MALGGRSPSHLPRGELVCSRPQVDWLSSSPNVQGVLPESSPLILTFGTLAALRSPEKREVRSKRGGTERDGRHHAAVTALSFPAFWEGFLKKSPLRAGLWRSSPLKAVQSIAKGLSYLWEIGQLGVLSGVLFRPLGVVEWGARPLCCLGAWGSPRTRKLFLNQKLRTP